MTVLPEIHIDTRGEFGIDNLDALMAEFPMLARRAVNSALSSEGYRLKLALQRAIRAGGPAGATWQKRHPFANILQQAFSSQRSRVSAQKRKALLAGQGEAAGSPLLKFAGGIRYRQDKDLNMISVGFVNPNAKFEEYIQKAEEGFETPITRKMRKLFFAIGMATRKSSIKSPSRPLIGPVFEAEKSLIASNLEETFFANMERYMKTGGK